MHFIGLDWGTSSLRAYSIDEQGNICHRATSERGLLAVDNRQFPQVLEEILSSLPEDGEYTAIVAAGMITSRTGWVETPYVQCPAPLDSLAANLTRLDTEQFGPIWFMPGLCQQAPAPDIMRGEETQLAGLECSGERVVIMPGTHSKWVRLVEGQVQQFNSYMTGDLYNAIRHHTIHQALPQDLWNDDDFREGVMTGYDNHRRGQGLLGPLFQMRARTILGTSASTNSESYLSGFLIGTEIGEAGTTAYRVATPYLIVANRELTRLYGTALEICGRSWESAGEDIAARGLFRIARAKQLI